MTTGMAKVAGVMGWPVAHSLSPRLHGYWLQQHGIDGAYIPMAVQPDKIEAALRALPVLGFRGCNLTVPHKERALDIVDHVDPVAARIGAVNTVIVDEKGKLKGFNTDYIGFIESLKASVPQWNPKSGPAVVLGAGGAARAVVVGLIEAGVKEVRIINRTEEKARALVEGLADGRTQLRRWPWGWPEEALADATLLVNTTTLGMKGQAALDVDMKALPPTAIVMDIVYVPLMTGLLQQAQARGNPVVTGIGMLLHQAAPGFEAWFGVRPAVTPELEKFVLSKT